jgi:putative ABC transport system permease protein
MAFFGGYFKDRRYSLPVYATDVTRTFHIYRSLFDVPEETLQKMRENRTGALVAKRLAGFAGWKVGDRISLSSTIWTNKDGTSDYPVDIVGLFESKDGATEGFAGAIFINYDYLNESRMFLRDSVNFFIAEIADPKSAPGIMTAIDAKFANSSSETHTMTEQALLESQMTTISDIELLINAIVAAAFFALLFVTASTMAQSVRERSPEFAMLKTLGFSNSAVVALVLAEALMLCVFAAVIGLLAARVVFLVVGNIFAQAGIPWIVILQSFGIAASLALISSALPALRAGRLTIIEALALKR